ncbi:MAG TPA: NAD(P)H-hydrate dehydratase, partial [Gammaproteobacteria bacterium]|nr:NAD(P)H-hydrate dehydratase [Gammaproteobacteria bacterium]
GLVRVATRGEHLPGIVGARPELLCHGVENVSDLGPLFHTASVIAIGPGLGRSAWASELFGAVLETDVPLVVDADALNLLATDPLQRQDWVLTPHPGEAVRLLNSSIAQVQADRFQAAQAIQRRYGGVVVLKGAGTLVQAGSGPTAVCDAGNPGMASAGMGDVLTGVIAGLLAQGMEIAGAAQLGVCLHAAAGDRAAAREGERGLLASDLFPHLRRLVNQRTCDS